MICRHRFTVTKTRFTLMRRGRTKFETINWYNLCLEIIQSQTCYPLIYCTNVSNQRKDIFLLLQQIYKDTTKYVTVKLCFYKNFQTKVNILFEIHVHVLVFIHVMHSLNNCWFNLKAICNTRLIWIDIYFFVLKVHVILKTSHDAVLNVIKHLKCYRVIQ